MATKSEIRRQIRAINRRSTEVFTRTIPRKVERALTAATVVVANKSLEYTPVEYGLLANSQFRDVRQSLTGFVGRVGYTANYAAALHNRTDWAPRPPDQKMGPAWNPRAKPGFVTEAADETRVTIRRIMLEDLRV